MIGIDTLNAMSAAEFVLAIGFVFEGSPWIASAAASQRPFADRRALHAAMVAVVDAAPPDAQIALIAAHPDLAGRVAREGRLTPASSEEQAGAGLDSLSQHEIAVFDAANDAYRKKFGFPFVIAAREHTKGSILEALARRVTNDRAVEIRTALDEIAKIARLRIEDAVS